MLVRAYMPRMWLAASPRGLEMKPVERFRTDYELDPVIIHGIRSADYLNWRFIDNPIGRYSVSEFIDADEPIGYCAYAQVGSVAVVCDFVTKRRYRNCLRLLVDHLYGRGFARIRFTGAGLKLRKYGFVRGRATGQYIKFKLPDGDWLITGCDTDAELDRPLTAAA